MDKEKINKMLRPLLQTGKGFYYFLGLLLIANAYFVYIFLLQNKEGHILQGLGNQGAIWGVLVTNIVNLIGISHVGIAISAFVRIMNLERYKQLARVAELVTVVALTTAVINIGLDVGRPDRYILYVVYYGRLSSPFVWSMTVITTYFLSSCVYLYLAMRRDLALCATFVPRLKWFYESLALGYTDTEPERKRHEKTVWWLAVLIIPIMVSVHSVYGLIFGLQAGRPGWYNPFMAPYFVLGAVVSGFSAIIIVVAILRKALNWEEYFPPKMIRGLGSFLGFITLLYIYFLLAEILTSQYAPPEKEFSVSSDILWGRFSWLFGISFLGGMVFPFILLFIQWAKKEMASITLTVFAALIINISMWIMRYLIVVPSFYHPLLPYKIATYSPTLIEWSLVFGTYAFATLFYLFLIKLVPVLELPPELAIEVPERVVVPYTIPAYRKALIWISQVTGVILIVKGIMSYQQVSASLIWVAGIVILISIPLQICLIPLKRIFPSKMKSEPLKKV